MTFRMSAVLGALVAAIVLTPSVFAHEGHNHDAPAAPVATTTPRAVAQSSTFEIAGLASGGELTLYVDRFETNEPVPSADVDVETPAGSVHASPQPDGSYTLPAPWLKEGTSVDL